MTQRRYLFFGAHPDDPDLLFGGCAVKLLKAGHQVKFVSVSSGDCGHYAMEPAALALRRHREAQESAKVAGLTGYEILDVPDCHVVCTLELRERLIRVIRDFEPDVVISHRLCDYHADHRATAQCVMDCAYLVRVPMYCADTPIPRKDPVFAYGYDAFTDPRPIRADAVTEIDSVAETKLRMLDCHRSQFYEWLPWNMGHGKIQQQNQEGIQHIHQTIPFSVRKLILRMAAVDPYNRITACEARDLPLLQQASDKSRLSLYGGLSTGQEAGLAVVARRVRSSQNKVGNELIKSFEMITLDTVAKRKAKAHSGRLMTFNPLAAIPEEPEKPVSARVD